ncbi:EEF1A lysine methyltransferase 3-like isoform X2 [Pristis pectinata]|uniref:EEF1A lysine methyltransferase 3-like isoform X2 n=1 Tax=Pristis pectinata TaxID=685728 RepID=UPI00223D2140|nr:EEF1A lysine methyltransferase 3-like isoform X2 [Pristis pectinata]
MLLQWLTFPSEPEGSRYKSRSVTLAQKCRLTVPRECCTVFWALALCRYFAEQKISFRRRKVIELGAGTGIVGILAVLLGGDVTFTDLPRALKEIESNISVNVPSSCIHCSRVRALSWGHNHTWFPGDYDFVLGSDIVYLPEIYPLPVRTLRHLSAQSATVYLSSKMRREHRTISFYEEILPQHFQCRLLHRNEEQNINLYKATQQEHHAGRH